MDRMKNLPDEVLQATYAKLNDLMSSSSAREKHKTETGVDIEKFGHRRSREEMLAMHNKALLDTAGARQIKKGGKKDSKTVMLGISASENVKPTLGAQQDWGACTPISVAALCVNTAHRRRQLRGRLIVSPVVFSGMISLLEDEAGDVVRVSIYKQNISTIYVSGRSGCSC